MIHHRSSKSRRIGAGNATQDKSDPIREKPRVAPHITD
ncbi:hypothetical protein BURMUCGD1_0082 [Burkholderia multivorans CGD1]|nr:hypothetical protein BURMUCGD1_0082 [Burkholderia multivorans CGD1]